MKFASLLILMGGLASASPILISLDNPNQTSAPGFTLSFTGTLTNTTAATLFINSDSFNLNSALTGDDSPFLNNAPVSLDPPNPSLDFQMFTVTLPAGTAPGQYLGDLTVLGGATADDQTVLGDVAFSVIVPTPEPSAMWLTPAALAFFLMRRRRART